MKVMSLISGNSIVPPTHTGFQTLWMHLRGVSHSSAKRVRFDFSCFIHGLTLELLVTDMLLSLLNICTKEELEEEDESFRKSETPEEHAERKRVIKSKILAVGRVSRVFALLR